MQFATFHDLEDQSVFITGGGSGIGADLTKGFLSQGAKVTFVQRSNPEKFLAECEGKYKYEPTFIKCDVSHIEELKIALQTTAKNKVQSLSWSTMQLTIHAIHWMSLLQSSGIKRWK